MLADRRQHLGGDPLLEALSFRLAAAQDRGVQAGFVDDQQLLVAAKGLHIRQTLFVVVEVTRHCRRFAVLECSSNIDGNKPRLFIDQQGADFASFELEGDDLGGLHGRIPFLGR
ncbi:hypothetical protein D9M71_670580 [compost metagenome]